MAFRSKSVTSTAQKMKFFISNFFSNCDQIRSDDKRSFLKIICYHFSYETAKANFFKRDFYIDL